MSALLNASTWPPIVRGAVTTSRWPSPLMSPAATFTPPRKSGPYAKSAGQFRGTHAAKDAHRAADCRAGDDVGAAVRVEIARRHRDAAGIDRREREPVGQGAEIRAAQHAHLATAAAAADDQVDATVGVDVARRDIDAAGEPSAKRCNRMQQRQRAAVDHAHRAAAGAGADDRVRSAVAVDVAEGDAHAAREVRPERKAAEDFAAIRGVQLTNEPAAAGCGSDKDDRSRSLGHAGRQEESGQAARSEKGKLHGFDRGNER